MERMRLGDLLVARGVLTPDQRDEVLAVQADRPRPFGQLAERMFGIGPECVEEAWAWQYAHDAQLVEPAALTPDPDALALVSPRQAWQFKILPVQLDGGELVAVACEAHLVRALRFAGWKLAVPCYFLIARAEPLGEALMHHYPIPGMSPTKLGVGLAAR